MSLEDGLVMYIDAGTVMVAVKAFRFTFEIDGDGSDRSAKMFRRELGIWRRLDHPNVVPFLGIAYGFGMRGAIEVSQFGFGTPTPVYIANGLHYFITKGWKKCHTTVHSFPVVHGDLNCYNVLLDANYTARLGDFGYASLVGNIPEALSYLQRSTARSGALRWIAPEQVDSEETFNRTTKMDIYSFGCVALQGTLLTDLDATPMLMSLQVLSGKQPWWEVRGDSAVVLRLAKGHEPGRPQSQMLNDSHWSLIQDCWSAIEERPAAEVIIPTIRQFLNDCPLSPPFCDLLPAWSSQADLGAESSLSVDQTEGSGFRFQQRG
ncbi:kinase-like domain-containing protein [Boletus coccyginus]|nr:kinase-like domain-containing protein [Boletus coccyginus]